MALFQPTNVIPSVLTGREYGTVDATQDITVSWQVNGNSPMVAYQVKIMQNDTDSTLKFDSTKITLATPFFGTNSLGNPKPFSMIITAAQLSAAGIVNGYDNGYKLTIKQWWSANDAVEQTSASFFITRKIPTLYLYGLNSYDAENFKYQDYRFNAAYSQTQGDAIEWRRWELQAYETDSWVTIDDTGPIFGPGDEKSSYTTFLYYYHNGFAVGVNENNQNVPIQHRIKCTVQTENGVIADTGWTEFTTKLSSTHRQNPLILCVQRNTDSMKIEMPKNFPIKGDANGPYSYTVQNLYEYLTLPAGTSIAFGGEGDASLGITPDYNYSVRCKMSLTDVSENVNCLDLDYGDYHIYLSFSPDGFFAKKGSTTMWSEPTAAVSGSFFEIQLTNSKIYWGVNDSGTIAAQQYDINEWIDGETLQGLTIYGPNIVRLVEISTPITFATFEQDLQSPYIYYSETNVAPLFEGNFHGTLYTGPIYGENTLGGPTDSLSIYRREKYKPVFQLIENIPFEQRTIYDYSALTNVTYEYFFMTMKKSGEYLEADDRYGLTEITPCWWNYTVLCCEQNMEGGYSVKKEYRFALDVASGSVGNNNSPTIFKNFTQYPLRQPATDNYRSGTLSAFIGKVENDQYVDSVNLMDELYALSTSKMTKFLKTRKGQIFQIETSAPVSQQIGDKYAVQPSKISLPWVEVGDASKANILGESAIASGVPTFSVAPATMELQMEYAENSQMGADSFSLVDGELYLNDPGIFQAEDFSLNIDSEVILNTD